MILVRNWLNFSVFYPHKVIKARNDDNQRRIYNAIGLKKKKEEESNRKHIDITWGIS